MSRVLTGKTAIVTRSGRGIGLVIARPFADSGATVVVCDIDEAATKAAVDQVPGSMAIACNVRDEEQVKALVERTVAQHGSLF